MVFVRPALRPELFGVVRAKLWAVSFTLQKSISTFSFIWRRSRLIINTFKLKASILLRPKFGSKSESKSQLLLQKLVEQFAVHSVLPDHHFDEVTQARSHKILFLVRSVRA